MRRTKMRNMKRKKMGSITKRKKKVSKVKNKDKDKWKSS
jgi:hypothetical protein